MYNNNTKVRTIAFYLPQYHPVPENDVWWGKGFTEWTNVTKAKPLFKDHHQPKLPADLGFYDLRIPEVREAQAQLAADYGLGGFCYWHYWFGDGKRILERPFDEVLNSRKPDFPFCVAWANETWSGVWHGNPQKILIQQHYPGKEDYINHFNYLLKAFSDDRYIKVDGKPLFCINAPHLIPDIVEFTDVFREQAEKSGLKGLYIVANTSDESWNPLAHGCDAVNIILLGNLYRGIPPKKDVLYRRYKNLLIKKKSLSQFYRKFRKRPVHIYNYKDVMPYLLSSKKFDYESYPCVIPNWDNSARSGLKSMIFKNASPQLFKEHLQQAINMVKDNEDDKKIVFIKSWNEWAEGNYLEPDSKFNHQYLEVLKSCVKL